MRSKIYYMKQYVLLGVFLCCFTWLSGQEKKEVYIFHTNDTHSCVDPVSKASPKPEEANKGGLVRRATFIKEERKDHPDLLLFDCGDFSQGSPYYNMFKGESEVLLMNEMGYNAVTIGNHEFDYGMDNMARIFKMAKFPIVCANYDVKGTVLEGIVKPYTILERSGIKIGVFGLGTRLEGLVQADKCEGVIYHDPYKKANETAAYLKNKEKCDLVICLSHLGWQANTNNPTSDEILIASTRNIDLVLGGHSHSLFENLVYYKNMDGEEIPLQQMGRWGVFVGKVKLELELEKQ